MSGHILQLSFSSGHTSHITNRRCPVLPPLFPGPSFVRDSSQKSQSREGFVKRRQVSREILDG